VQKHAPPRLGANNTYRQTVGTYFGKRYDDLIQLQYGLKKIYLCSKTMLKVWKQEKLLEQSENYL
jgi:hypothetical protein